MAVRDLQTLFSVGATGALSDGELLDRFVARREEAIFEAITHRHGPMVWGVCRRVLRDHHDAEDAFQATFLVLARKASSVMPREKLGNWLYGVAYQTALKARSMRAKRRVRESQVSDMPEPMVVPHDLRDALAESLDRELSRLPEKYRIPIVLCELEGKSHREAAEQVGWPIGTVSGRLSRARAMLAKRMAQRGVSLSVGSLTVMLAQDAASASMPTRLIGSTVQAASLITAGRVVMAGLVSAEVVTLMEGVLKTMLLKKLLTFGSLAAGILVLVAGVALAVPQTAKQPAPAPGGGPPFALAVPQPAKQPAPAPAAEPDRLVRALLGVSSIPTSFPVPNGKNWCHLAIAKFQDGKFDGYVSPLGPIESFHADLGRLNYEAELGWAPRDGKYGYFLVTPNFTHTFEADDFFGGLRLTLRLAEKRAPTQKLGPFSVLGFAAAGGEPGADVRDVIRGGSKVVVFLMAPFETEDQAKDFVKSLPELSAD